MKSHGPGRNSAPRQANPVTAFGGSATVQHRMPDEEMASAMEFSLDGSLLHLLHRASQLADDIFAKVAAAVKN